MEVPQNFEEKLKTFLNNDKVKDSIQQKLPKISDQLYTCLTIGGCGTGKSTVNNILYHGDSFLNMKQDDAKFKSGQIQSSGLTQDIQQEQCHLFGNNQNPELHLYDIPGNGDFELDLAKYETQMTYLLKSKRLDAIIVCLKNSDMDRFTLEQVQNCMQLKNMIEKLDPEYLYLCITKCDKYMPESSEIDNKLKAFKDHGIVFKKENLIYFKKDQESLQIIAKQIMTNKRASQQKFTDDPIRQQNKLNQETLTYVMSNPKLKEIAEEKLNKQMNEFQTKIQQLEAKLSQKKNWWELAAESVSQLLFHPFGF